MPDGLEPEKYQIPAVAWPGYLKFNEFADFAWKVPRFIDDERKEESKKLRRYFPISGTYADRKRAKMLRALRQSLEAPKIEESFPLFLNNAVLFEAASLYESEMVYLCNIGQIFIGEKFKDQKGQGFSKVSDFLKRLGIKRSVADAYDQAEAAIVIRNCLMHARGLIDLSRDRSRILSIAKKSTHLSKYTRDRLKKGDERYLLKVENSTNGLTLKIPDEYPHIATGLLRDHFVDVARQLSELFPIEELIQRVHDRDGNNSP